MLVSISTFANGYSRQSWCSSCRTHGLASMPWFPSQLPTCKGRAPGVQQPFAVKTSHAAVLYM